MSDDDSFFIGGSEPPQRGSGELLASTQWLIFHVLVVLFLVILRLSAIKTTSPAIRAMIPATAQGLKERIFQKVVRKKFFM
jgi:hypothetical protein